MDNERDGYANACKALAVHDALTALRAEVEGMDGWEPNTRGHMWAPLPEEPRGRFLDRTTLLAAIDARRGA